MKLYHTTPGPQLEAILADGFPSGSSVRLAEGRPEGRADLNGQAYILLDIPEDAIRSFEFDELGTPAREFAVPAEVVNSYPILASRPAVRPSSPTVPPPAAVTPKRRIPMIALAAVGVVLVAGVAFGIYSLTRDDDNDSNSSPAPAAARTTSSPKQQSQPAPKPRRERTGSVAVGSPQHGRLEHGVPFPAAGANHFTWDVAHNDSPNPRSRRYGTDYVVQDVLKAVRRYRKSHPHAPKVGIGDISRRRGGDLPGNPGHENGLVVTVLYPRHDGAEQGVSFVDEVDPGLTQALLDQLAKVGATAVSLDPRLGLKVPRGVAQTASGAPRMDVRFRKRS
ncbi:MAG TPA: hypothetical protein VGF21_17570 [Thermoleophilaceae bacterium]